MSDLQVCAFITFFINFIVQKRQCYAMMAIIETIGACGSVAIKVLCYKPEVAGSRPNEVNGFFQFI
jgi:hypothetical protein